VIIEGSKISYAGPAADAPAADGAELIAVPAVMPGMWDCHAHFLGIRHGAIGTYYTDTVQLRSTRSVKDAEAALQAGFTSVREAWGIGIHLAQAVREGTVNGPSIYAPGAVLSVTGGHGDLHSIPLDWVHDITHRNGELRLCDGVSDCIRAVREQLRLGARVIKIFASGGLLSEVDDPMHQQFRADELRAIVETAGLAERVVMAHCHGKPGIMAALQAGVRTIEHGTYLDDEACAAMREQGAILVPTRWCSPGCSRLAPTQACRRKPSASSRSSLTSTPKRSAALTRPGSPSRSVPTSSKAGRTCPSAGVRTARSWHCSSKPA
jgi:imidazolonepropionase-like amidohydrolase